MKLLLDENLPHQLRTEITGHDVFTVAYMGWSGIENGALLAEAAKMGFDALVTNDRGLEHEQNVGRLTAPARTTRALQKRRYLKMTGMATAARGGMVNNPR